MNVKLSKRGTELFRNVSPVSEIMYFTNPARLLKHGIDPSELISFGGGWVNHPSPGLLREVYKAIAGDEVKFHFSGGYSPANGDDFFKEAVIKFENKLFSMTGLKPENIAAGQSSTELTFNLLSVLLDKGDKICLLDPSYCNYPMQIITGSMAEIIRFPVVNYSDFEYIANKKETIIAFRDFIEKERPKVILLVSPDNPTSQVLSDDFVYAAYDAVKHYGGVVVVDFAYKSLIFGEPPEYFSRPPDGNFVTIHSNSKWCRGLGRRLGWIEAPPYIIDSYEDFQYNTILSPDRLHQMAFSEYVEKAVANHSLAEYFQETRDLYKKTAELTVQAIEDHIGLPYLEPQGGLYTCLKVPVNSAKFVRELLSETGVLFVPGWGFGRTLSKAVRISYGPLVHNHTLIRKGLEKTGNFIQKHFNS